MQIPFITQRRYASEVIHRMAVTIKNGRLGEPEPMPDCIIVDAPEPTQLAVTHLYQRQHGLPVVDPPTRYCVKTGDCYTSFYDRDLAIAHFRAVTGEREAA